MKTGSLVRISVNALGAIAASSLMQGGAVRAITAETNNILKPFPAIISQNNTVQELTPPPVIQQEPLTPMTLPIQPSQLRRSETLQLVVPAPTTPINTSAPFQSPVNPGVQYPLNPGPSVPIIENRFGTISTPPPPPNIPSTIATPTAVAPVRIAEEDYRLGAGDTIQLQFFNVPEYDGSYQILTDGSVNLPLVGRIPLKGLNLRGAGDRISSAYASELRYPDVTINLTARRPLQIVMTGEIIQPGLYVFPSDVQGQAPRLFQALQTAGGITQAGDLSNVQVIRDDPTPGRSQTVNVNLFALLQQGDLSQNIDLRDGDVISIPPTQTLDLDNIERLYLSNVAPQPTQPLDIAIVGEVSLPGPYRFDPGSQVGIVQAIQQAGGLSPFADVRQVSLERKTRSGSIQTINVDLFAILETGRIDQDVPLQRGDVVTIPATELTNSEVSAIASSTLASGPIEVALLGEVEQPGSREVQPDTSLNQAILAAGGFNGIARKEVKLVRFNPDGTVTERKIDVDLSRTINSEDNPILKPNDIVVVGKSTWGAIKDVLGSISQNINFLLPFLFFLN
ncbi:MAG: SLBB domain-containing protein [Limnothrix sp.]